MRQCRPLAGSCDAPDYHQLWRVAGIWRRAINFYTIDGKLLTLHHQGCGISPGGWVLRSDDFHNLHTALNQGIIPLTRADGIQVGSILLCPPVRYISLRLKHDSCAAVLPAGLLVHQQRTGLFGSLMQATRLPLQPELSRFVHCFLSALQGKDVDWRPWLGKGPGLTPSQDDMLLGMMLAACYHGLLVNKNAACFFGASGDLRQFTTLVSASYLYYAVQSCFASPLLHFTHSLGSRRDAELAIKSLLALGHTSGADTLLGFWLVQQRLKVG